MPIAVHCPECQALFHVGDEYAGRPGRCPECGAVLRVPGAESHDSHAHADPDPYSTPRPVEAYEEPFPSRRRRDPDPNHDRQQRDDFDDRYRPRQPGQAFDPQARAAAWERTRKGLWYVQVAVILYAFSQLFQTGFMLSRGMKDPNAVPMDSGMVAVACGSLVVMLAAAAFGLLGRFACIRVPYVPARGWAKASFGMALGSLFLICTAFCVLVMGVAAAAGQANPNGGAMALVFLAVMMLLLVGLTALGGEGAALMSMIQIGTGLKAASAAGWSRVCLGLMVFLVAVGTVGFCILVVYVGEQEKKKQAAQGPVANNGNPAPVPDPKNGKAPNNPPAANQPPPPNPFEQEPLDEDIQVVMNAILLGMIFLYLTVFSIAIQKTRGAIRREIKVLTGEADKDPWDADHGDRDRADDRWR